MSPKGAMRQACLQAPFCGACAVSVPVATVCVDLGNGIDRAIAQKPRDKRDSAKPTELIPPREGEAEPRCKSNERKAEQDPQHAVNCANISAKRHQEIRRVERRQIPLCDNWPNLAMARIDARQTGVGPLEGARKCAIWTPSSRMARTSPPP